MEEVKLEDARARLEELVERAVNGETIVIETAAGKTAALGPAAPVTPTSRPVFDWAAHFRWLESQPMDPRPQQDVIDEWRGKARY
jgi:antitoxin (DNA-binding transcriptional repressor) of toxin-antitoxin stability system